MTKSSSKVITVGAMAIAGVTGGLLYWLSVHRAPPPAELKLLACRALSPERQRIGIDKLHVYFDVHNSNLTIRVVTRDMPPVTEYLVAFKDSSPSTLEISNGFLSFEKEFKSTLPVFSVHRGERDVHDFEGHVVAKDHWGYLSGGERWRQVIFSWGDEVGYRPAPANVADKWDQVISSACVSRK